MMKRDCRIQMLQPSEKLVQTDCNQWIVAERHLIEHWFHTRVAVGRIVEQGRGVIWQVADLPERVYAMNSRAKRLEQQLHEDVRAARMDADHLNEIARKRRQVLNLPASEWAEVFHLEVTEGNIDVQRELVLEVISFINKACQAIEYALSHDPEYWTDSDRLCLVNWGMVIGASKGPTTPGTLVLQIDDERSNRDTVVLSWQASGEFEDGYILNQLTEENEAEVAKLSSNQSSYTLYATDSRTQGTYLLTGSGPNGTVSSNTIEVSLIQPSLTLQYAAVNEDCEFQWDPQEYFSLGYRLLREGGGEELWTTDDPMVKSVRLRHDEHDLVGTFVLEGRSPRRKIRSNAIVIEDRSPGVIVPPLLPPETPPPESVTTLTRSLTRPWWMVLGVAGLALCLLGIWYLLQHWPPYRPVEYTRDLVLGGESVPELRFSVTEPVLSARVSLVSPDQYLPPEVQPDEWRTSPKSKTEPTPGSDLATGPSTGSETWSGSGAGTESGTRESTRSDNGSAKGIGTGPDNGAGTRSDNGSAKGVGTGPDNEAGTRSDNGSGKGVGTGPDNGSGTGSDNEAGRGSDTRVDTATTPEPLDPGFGCNQMTYGPEPITSWLEESKTPLVGGRLIVGVTLFLDRGLLTDPAAVPGGQLAINSETVAGYGMKPIDTADRAADPKWVWIGLEIDPGYEPKVDDPLPLPWAAGIRGASGVAPMSIHRSSGHIEISHDQCTWRWWVGILRKEGTTTWPADLRVVPVDDSPLQINRVESSRLRQILLPTVAAPRAFRVEIFDSKGNIIAKTIKFTLEPGS